MDLHRCPGQDTINFTPDDVFEVPCPECGKLVEFFKDDPTRRCPHCGNRFPNPKLDLGCASRTISLSGNFVKSGTADAVLCSEWV